MSASSHLGITLREYDARIRTFIPDYDELLDAAAGALAAARPRPAVVVDLGTGTGALAARSLARAAVRRIVGVDQDQAMLEVAAQRVGRRFAALHGSFEQLALPPCDAVTASFALHHLPTPGSRRKLFKGVRKALGRRGVLIIADCYLASDERLRRAERRQWLDHLERTYSPRRAAGYLRAWATEDHYAALQDEVDTLVSAGLVPDVVWRRGSFAVIAATRASPLTSGGAS